jgi:hypothetical protein
MMTRAEYMAGNHGDREEAWRLHRAYYSQYVNERTIAHVLRCIGTDRILASTDPYFNDISLREWDALCGFRQKGMDIEWFAPGYLPRNDLFKEAGTWCSPSDLISIAKEAARQWKEQHDRSV